MSDYDQSGTGDGQDQGMGQQDSGYGQDQSSQGGYGQDQSSQGGYGQDQGTQGGGAGGRANDLLGKAEGLLGGSSDPRAQQAEGLIDKARGFLGGGQGDTTADTGSGDGQ